MSELDTEMKSAAARICRDELVAFATETVYGLGGNALSDHAVAAIYAAKGRPQFNPLIVHVLSQAEAKRYVKFNPQAERLAEAFWPGALTLVLPRTEDCPISLLASAGLDTIALRSPSHLTARALLAQTGLPIAAPSANKSGQVSPTLAAHVRAEFGDDKFVLDGGACPEGLESTVLDLSTDTPTLLRPGTITQAQLEAVIGNIAIASKDSEIKSPGMLERHYAPRARLRLNATHVETSETLLAFGAALPGAQYTENLSPSGNLKEAAANLFRMLRALDGMQPAAIAVMPIPDEGLGVAINDRLRRAAVK